MVDILLELRLEKCEDRKEVRNIFTGKVVLLCNSINICCPLRGGPANPEGSYSPTCKYDSN